MAALHAGLQYLLILLQVGLAIAIAVIVRQDLWWYVPGTLGTCYTSWWGTYTWCTGEWICLMTTSSTNICSYAWWLTGISLFLSLFIGFSMACGSRRPGRSCACGAAVAALFGFAWWLAGAIVLTVNGKNANGTNAGQVDVPPYDWAENYRTAVWAMAWAEMSLFFFSTLIAIATCRSAPAQQQQQAAAGCYPAGAYAAGPYQQPPPYTAYQQPPPGYAVPPPPPMAYPPPGQPYPVYGAQPGYAVPPPYPPGTSAEPKMV